MKDSEKQILLICQEECAEVTQAISKVFRFGYDSEYNGRTNQQRLTEEVGDLLAMIDLMVESGIVDEAAIEMASAQKKIKLKQWSNIFDKPNLELVKN
jgi:NTP pyrophosphatase (non-canonical NTP hydrolase)